MSFEAGDCAVALRNVQHRYHGADRNTLDLPRFEIASGQCVALIGASGAGKSTLLRLLDGRLRGWSGEAFVLGHTLQSTVPPPRVWRCETGFVFQEFALIERLTVLENVLNGRLGRTHQWWSLLGRFTDKDAALAMASIHDVGLDELADTRVDRLSGGQRQRVAIARCLAQEPLLVLADEPVSNLDPVNAEGTLELLRDCTRKRGATLLVTSHQPRLVERFVDRVVALDRGKIVFDGGPELLHDERLADIYDEAARRHQPEPVL